MKDRAPQNRTLDLTEEEIIHYRKELLKVDASVKLPDIIDRTICGNIFEVIDHLPSKSVDLIIADPPYNLTKSFSSFKFTQISLEDYASWLETWIPKLLRIMKPNASIYICGDWRSSAAIHSIVEKLFVVRNRITWEREKGRGASKNWKNCSEDIWFCTMSNDYTFNVDDVKLTRRVIAPYTNKDGTPKDWEKTDKGDFRITHPSNFW
ncbi:site-specific DNA-methyltransferase, partial [bacterium]|nr:site-specific DNA-methyltransferase [bacterium]